MSTKKENKKTKKQKKRERIIQKAIDFVTKRNYDDIKVSHSDEFEDPKSFKQVSNDEIITPFITAVDRGHKHYFELAIKNDDIQDTVSRWKFLSFMANNKNGELHLFAPHGHKAFTERLTTKYNLNAKVISI